MKISDIGVAGFVSSALTFCTALLALNPVAVYAGAYKCIDADGNTTYSQMQCPVDETTDKIIASPGNSSAKNTCAIARHFMSKTARQMQRGQSSSAIFDQYGGIDSIPRTSVALINYVYTFQYNHKVTAERITSLSMARCKSGSFGPTTCDDFPYSYIDELGGCDLAALGPNYGRGNNGDSERELEERGAVRQSANGLNIGNQLGNQQLLNPAIGLQSNNKFKCIADTQAELANVANQMRSPQSVSAQDALRAKRRQLQKRLSGC